MISFTFGQLSHTKMNSTVLENNISVTSVVKQVAKNGARPFLWGKKKKKLY